jgi:DNA polymerase-3 subunit gamma/tau
LAYLSLNRRWRPRSFHEVTRQEHVTRTLQNAINLGRVAQAYLFGGRRGTGKTTMARLLGMCLNCQASSGPTDQPCGQCASCVSISAGASPDVIELDAASNRGIDEIRSLQENVRLSPMSGRFKVYIIDEAHQMTKDAYNAFLKTLEEPPAHVVFVLATTEPEKILPTVRSRCQRFDFRPVPEADIVGRLRAIAAAEKIQAADELLILIARKSEGSLRDALGLLEQCVSFAGESPSVEDFLTVTGGLERDALRKLATCVSAGQASCAIMEVDTMLRAGRDPAAILGGLVAYLRDVFLTRLRLGEASSGQAGPDGRGPAGAVDLESTLVDAELVSDAQIWATERLLAFLGALVRADAEMRYSPQPRLVLEMVLLALASDTDSGGQAAAGPSPAASAFASTVRTPTSGPNASDPGPATRSRDPGFKAVPSAPAATAPPPGGSASAPAATAPPPGGSASAPAATAPGSGPAEAISLQWLRDNWDDLLNRVRQRSVFARAFLLGATPIGLSEGIVTLGFESQFHKEQMEVDKNRSVCEAALSESAGAKLLVRCRLNARAEGAGSAPAARELEDHPEPRPVSRAERTTPTPRAERTTPRPPARPTATGKVPGSAAPATPGPRPGSSGAALGSGSAGSASRQEDSGLPARPVSSGPPVPATGPASPGPKSSGSEAVRSALSIFGGRVVDDSGKSKP